MKKFLFVALVTTTCFFHATAQNKMDKQHSITTTGVAETEVTPDEIYVQVSLQEYDKKGVGKVDIEAIRNNFLNAIKAMNIQEKDIAVQSYQGWNGNYVIYQKKKKQNPDLKAGITYLVKLNNTKQMDDLVGRLDDEATQSFSIAKTAYSKADELKKDLEIKALKAAREKAIYLSTAVDEKIGKAINIQPSQETGEIRPVMYNAMMLRSASDDGGAPMNVDFKKIKYEISITAEFELI